MGRNIVGKKNASDVEEETKEDSAPLDGGTLGVPEVKAAPPLPGTARVGMVVAPEADEDAPPVVHAVERTYRVTRGGPVMFNNCRSEMKAGKIVGDASIDIDMLRGQGIELEELPTATQ